MSRLAVIGGNSILGAAPPAGLSRTDVEVEGSSVAVLEGEGWALLQRHGLDGYRAAFAIDHRANLRALVELGCDRILAIGSTGALRADLPVGTFLCPDDFIALQLGLSHAEDDRGQRVPEFNPSWRGLVLDAWRRETEVPIVDGGVYWQTIGPRFETRAEIRMIAQHADLVGMTIASECVLAAELSVPYAAICVVDNLANGIGEAPLTTAEFEAGKASNQERLLEALAAVVPALVLEPAPETA